jgi:hypothetical protein
LSVVRFVDIPMEVKVAAFSTDIARVVVDAVVGVALGIVSSVG